GCGPARAHAGKGGEECAEAGSVVELTVAQHDRLDIFRRVAQTSHVLDEAARRHAGVEQHGVRAAAGVDVDQRREAVLSQRIVGRLALLQYAGWNARRLGCWKPQALCRPLIHQEHIDIVVDERRDGDGIDGWQGDARFGHLGSFYTTDGCRQYTKWSEVRRSGQVASRWSRCSSSGLPTPVITARAAHQAPLLVRQQRPAVRAADAAVARRGVRGRRACRHYVGQRFGPEAHLAPVEDVVDDAGSPRPVRVAGRAVWLEWG